MTNAYIVHDLDNWPKIPFRKFTLKNWNFGNGSARNVIIFGLDNSSSSHTDNSENNFLVLGKGKTFGINGSFYVPEKMFSISFSKAKRKFYLSLHYNTDNSSLFF